MDSNILPIILPKYKQLYAYNIEIIGHTLHLQHVNFVFFYSIDALQCPALKVCSNMCCSLSQRL